MSMISFATIALDRLLRFDGFESIEHGSINPSQNYLFDRDLQLATAKNAIFFACKVILTLAVAISHPLFLWQIE